MPKSIYVDLAEIPIYTAARFLNSSDALSVVNVTTIVSDHLRNVKRTLQKTLFVTAKDTVASSAQDTSNAVASSISPSGRLQVVLREVRGDAAEKKRYVEIWESDRLLVQKEVTKLHAEFYTDDMFSSLSFSPSEEAVIYTAEANADDSPTESEDTASYKKFEYQPHFGERLFGRKRPTVFLMRWTDKQSEQKPEALYRSTTDVGVYALVPSLPKDHIPVSFGQGTFAEEDWIYATGYERTKDGRLLGPSGCFNRPSGIWSIRIPSLPPPAASLDGSEKKLSKLDCPAARRTPSDRSCRSPEVIRDSKSTLIWLSHKVYGPHHSCARLHALDIATGEERIVVNTVSEPASPGAFPGLYVDQLSDFLKLSLGSSSSSFVAVQSVWASAMHILLISLEDGKVHRLTPEVIDDVPYSWFLLSTDGEKKILCSRSAPGIPHQLVMGDVAEKPPYTVNWTVIDKPTIPLVVQAKLKILSVSVHSLPDRNPVQTIVIKPTGPEYDNLILPCITLPHGGPHIASIIGFNASTAAQALLGYTISMPNYTGSLGYGEKYIKALVGTAGTLDVQDCMASIKHLVQLGIAKEGPGYQFVLGGSHGGFIGGHLIGQYPSFFSAAVLRNPVIAAGEMCTATDIPDWCYSEFDLPYHSTTSLDNSAFKKLQTSSPIAHVDAVQAPVLLHIGANDQRVPPTQGRNYYHALKGRGKTVEMLWFPGQGHAIDSVEELKAWTEATMDWFAKFRA